MALQPLPSEKIDRTTTTPFLLRLYYRQSAFHSPAEFHTVPPPPQLQNASMQIYTWPTCTLAELTSLVTSALPQLLPSPAVGTRIGYRLVFPDTRSVGQANSGEGQGRWLSKELGSVVVGQNAGGGGEEGRDGDDEGNEEDPAGLGPLTGDADKTLADARFVIGDYISCAIFPPLPDGRVAPLPVPDRGTGRPGGGRGRENGFGGPREFRGGRGGRGGYGGYGGGGFAQDRERGFGGAAVPSGDWRRGERVPEGMGGGFGGRGRGRGRPY
ncbi:hypothetical protein M8818_007618 [Zalaria obscura]|uniref:Uncharacterized protein n=1 Tax=Zalaria obscura TaxID=2024903 RepID=A0ACC3S484_9PEZI